MDSARKTVKRSQEVAEDRGRSWEGGRNGEAEGHRWRRGARGGRVHVGQAFLSPRIDLTCKPLHLLEYGQLIRSGIRLTSA